MVFKSRLIIQSVRAVARAVLFFVLVLPVAAQIPGALTPSTPPAKTEQPTDPLGRTAPRGTITAFIRAVHREDFVSAARYMQITAKQRPNTETLARHLNELLDRYFHQPVAIISDSPQGALNDGLPLDRERVGPLAIGGQEVYVELERVNDKEAGQIWLISSGTLTQVPALYGSIEKPWIERVMPETLLRNTVMGISLAQVLLWAASISIPILLLSLVFPITLFLARRMISGPARRRALDSWYAGLRWPIISVLALCTHIASLPLLGVSLRFRYVYTRFLVALLVVALAWLIRRLSTLFFDYTRSQMHRREQSGARSLILLSGRLLNVFITLVAIFVILTIIGVNTQTALAGMGLAGVALALGAQKTVENILGVVFLLTDKALAVGDTCSISNRLGVVEDITLRSVRLRTLEQTVLSIPAGGLSQGSIENFSARGKILVQTILPLRYGTSAEQLRSTLAGIHRLLVEHAEIETETARVRLVNYGARAIELELFAYVLTSDIMRFLAVREDVLLQIAKVVEASGIGFARPEIVDMVSESTSAQPKQRAS